MTTIKGVLLVAVGLCAGGVIAENEAVCFVGLGILVIGGIIGCYQLGK